MRVRSTLSSNSLMLPFIPSSNRSFARQGSYTPSRSITRASTKPQSSSRWCQSRPLRASREASKHSTAPTSPAHSHATSRSKPGRETRRCALIKDVGFARDLYGAFSVKRLFLGSAASSLFGAGKAVLHPVACDQVPGAHGRGQGTETLAKLGGLPL